MIFCGTHNSSSKLYKGTHQQKSRQIGTAENILIANKISKTIKRFSEPQTETNGGGIFIILNE